MYEKGNGFNETDSDQACAFRPDLFSLYAFICIIIEVYYIDNLDCKPNGSTAMALAFCQWQIVGKSLYP